jgi:hypothetical protein
VKAACQHPLHAQELPLMPGDQFLACSHCGAETINLTEQQRTLKFLFWHQLMTFAVLKSKGDSQPIGEFFGIRTGEASDCSSSAAQDAAGGDPALSGPGAQQLASV